LSYLLSFFSGQSRYCSAPFVFRRVQRYFGYEKSTVHFQHDALVIEIVSPYRGR